MKGIDMRRLISAAVLATAAATSGIGIAHAQDSVAAADAENARQLWFVEFSNAPTIEGTSSSAVRADKANFRAAARAAGISFTERRSFDTLFNGMSIAVGAADRLKIMRLPSVKAMYPVDIIQAPTVERDNGGSAADLAAAINMTGAAIAQNQLGLTGKGIKVGVIDTGIDIDHLAFGGSGVAGTTPFGNHPRIVAGYDFVGDAYNAAGTGSALIPVEDPNPDDCNGHGTHVAGIVGADGGGLRGVAPGVSLGAYRVFGCDGSSDSDIIVAALERAYADGMQVINQSLGAARQWPQYPTAQATTRLVNKGVVMVTSTGNNGPGGSTPDGLYAAGAPGTGAKVIATASYDNTASTQLAFSVQNQLFGYNRATAAPPSPTSGTSGNGVLVPIGTPASTDSGCTAAQFAGFPVGSIALIRRGTCSFNIKSVNAQNAGAAAVVIYNNVAGAAQNITVVGPPNVTIPVVSISDVQGATLFGFPAPRMLTWTAQTVSTPIATAGLISSFSSFGVAADLSLKPQIGAPGGLIYSSYPLELGAYATLSGTSMASPHVAGGAALVLEARPNTPSQAMKGLLQNSADPKLLSISPGSGILDHTFRQGAGMLDIVGSINATTKVEPSEISVGESAGGAKTFTVKVKNESNSTVTYALSHVAGAAAGPNPTTGASYANVPVFSAPATVTFSAPSVAVPANGIASFDVTIDANATLANRALYGGYVVLTPQGGGAVYRVPFAGFKGDYQSTQVLTPTANGFPWLAKLNGANFVNQPNGASYTLANGDIPYFLLHLDHMSRKVLLEAFDAKTGRSWHRVSLDEYVTRSGTPTSFFSFTWDGITFTGKGKNDNQYSEVPNGQYIVKVSVLKALGDETNPAHWEAWTSPVVTIARP